MRFLSLCSGIEAASVAWQPLGFKAVGYSETDPFCCALLAQRYPDITNFGDVTKIEAFKTFASGLSHFEDITEQGRRVDKFSQILLIGFLTDGLVEFRELHDKIKLQRPGKARALIRNLQILDRDVRRVILGVRELKAKIQRNEGAAVLKSEIEETLSGLNDLARQIEGDFKAIEAACPELAPLQRLELWQEAA